MHAIAEETVVKTAFYGLTFQDTIVQLPEDEYASGALKHYNHELIAKGKEPEDFVTIFSAHDYTALWSQLDMEANDADGDGYIPKFFAIIFATLRAVFPHANVDTVEEAREFIAQYPLEVAGPYNLANIRATWPRPEPETH